MFANYYARNRTKLNISATNLDARAFGIKIWCYSEWRCLLMQNKRLGIIFINRLIIYCTKYQVQLKP